MDSLYEIEEELRCRIYLWGQRATRGKYDCVRTSPFMLASNFDTYVDIILDCDHENAISTENVGVIFDIDKIIPEESRCKKQSWTLFQAAAIKKYPKLENKISGLREKVAQMELEWNRSEWHFADGSEFYTKFKLGVQVWNINSCGRRKVIREKIFDRYGSPKLIG